MNADALISQFFSFQNFLFCFSDVLLVHCYTNKLKIFLHSVEAFALKRVFPFLAVGNFENCFFSARSKYVVDHQHMPKHQFTALGYFSL